MADTANEVRIGEISAQLTKASRLVLSTDGFWVQTGGDSQGNSQSVLIPAEFVRAYLADGIKPSIGEDGMWYINGKSTGVVAKGVTPLLRGGVKGVEASYDNGKTWTQVSAYSDINVDVASLEEEYKKIIDSEKLRVQAENTRVESETARATAEKNRATAESLRETAETGRADAESSRVTAENARVEAEKARSTNEDTRKTAETVRADAETERASAETDRDNAEKTRIGNESARVTAEQGRSDAEQERETAESARVENEKARASAETERASAETQRANAETQRESDFSSAKGACETAASNANSAADKANDTASHPGYVDADGYYCKYNADTKAYEKTTVNLKGPQGNKGDKGDPLTYESLTEAQKNEMASRVSIGTISASEISEITDA